MLSRSDRKLRKLWKLWKASLEALRLKLAEQATGVADTSRYENQIAEMEMFMKQTWEDKEKQSLEHEEERKRLEQEAERRHRSLSMRILK